MSGARAGQVQDEYERPVPGASVYVYNNDNTAAAVFSDSGLTILLNQPLSTDQFGSYTYYAADGYYREDTWFGGKLRYREAGIAIGSAADLLQNAVDQAQASATNAAQDETAAASSASQAAATLAAIQAAIPTSLVTNSSLNASTRALLAALNHAPGLPAILTEAGYEGVFIPNNANLAAQVTNDPNQEKYVAYSSDPTGASGAWQRVNINRGRLTHVFAEALPPGDITLPAAFNNQLGVTIYWDGSAAQYYRNPYDIIDFTKTQTCNNYYLNAAGNDANNGTSSGTAWRTIDHAFATMVSPAILHLTDNYVGTTGLNSATTKVFSGMLKIKGEGNASGNGRTRFLARRENETVLTFAWAASGGNGAYVSTVAAALRNYHAMFDANYLDAKGIPKPITAAPDAATCQSTAGTFFYDGSANLYVHMWDGRIPDPDNGWLYSEPGFHMDFAQGLTTSAGVILLENLEFFFNAGPGSITAIRLQCNVTGSPNSIRMGKRNCLCYGAGGNGFENYDGSISVADNCHSAYNRIDNHNYSSFVSTGSQGAFITVYEHNCTSHHAGFGGWTNQDALSTSSNGTTSHRSQHVLRTNGVHRITNGGIYADVNGVLSVNINCGGGQPNAGGTALTNSIFWHDTTTPGTGTTGGMYLWGCYGHDNGDAACNLLDMTQQSGGSANMGKIYVKYWRGQTVGNVIGPLKDWAGAAV